MYIYLEGPLQSLIKHTQFNAKDTSFFIFVKVICQHMLPLCQHNVNTMSTQYQHYVNMVETRFN